MVSGAWLPGVAAWYHGIAAWHVPGCLAIGLVYTYIYICICLVLLPSYCLVASRWMFDVKLNVSNADLIATDAHPTDAHDGHIRRYLFRIHFLTLEVLKYRGPLGPGCLAGLPGGTSWLPGGAARLGCLAAWRSCLAARMLLLPGSPGCLALPL